MKRGRVLINGAGGFLGRHTVEAFAAANYELRVTDLPHVRLDWAHALGAQVIHADLRRFREAEHVVEGIDGVVNVAGVFDFSRSLEELVAGNVTVTEHMCRASVEAGVRKFVHIASVAVYGTPAYTPIDEGGPKRSKNQYELTKRLGEEVVFAYQREAGLPATSLRPAPIYGPYSRYIHNLMFATASLMAASERARGFELADSPYCSHVHVVDVARAALLLMALPRTIGHAYNCADLTPIRWSDLFNLIADTVGLHERRRIPWSRPIMDRVLPLMLRLWPERQFAKSNARLARAWARLVESGNLEPALSPHLDRDMFAYLAGDHIYDTTALRDLGFEWTYPETVPGLLDTHEWLVSHRWIPAAAPNTARKVAPAARGSAASSAPPKARRPRGRRASPPPFPFDGSEATD